MATDDTIQRRVWPEGVMQSTLPPHHDPGERCCLFESADGWLILGHAINDPNHAYFAPRGLLHLQLWHPQRRVSVLTPSLLTRGTFEVWASSARERLCCYGHLATFMLQEFDLAPPCPRVIQHFNTWFVGAAMIGVVPNSPT